MDGYRGGHGGGNRGHHNEDREEFEATCAACDKKCKVPFKPSGDRPVYCQDCYRARRRN